MDEFAQIRRLLPVSETDEAAKRRAQSRLDEAIASERASIAEPPLGPTRPPRGRTRRRRFALAVGIAATLALVGLVLQVVLPSGGGGPALSAAAELQRLAKVAGVSSAIEIGNGFLYTDVTQQGIQSNEDLSGGATWNLLLRERLETWVAADASGRQVTTIEEVSFPTNSDRDVWIQQGRPEIPKVGTSSVQRYRPGGLAIYDVASLPSDPDALRSAIHGGKIIQVPRGSLGLFTAIGRLLFQPDTPPAVRRGLFDLAAEIPGIQVQRSLTDPLGRRGDGFTFGVGSASETLVVDPGTARLLARVTLDDQGLTSWQASVREAVVATDTTQG
jgi:hypothetical protein